MLKLCDDLTALLGLEPSPYSARIQALFCSHGVDHSFSEFWVQDEKTAVSKVGGVVTLCCGENCDFEELGEFLNIIGARTVCCDEVVRKKLSLPSASGSFIVRYEGGAGDVPIESPRELREVFLLLKECGFELGDYGAFLSDYCARLRAGRAKTAAVFENGALRATASALFIGENAALLGAVATAPQSRGRGLASRLVSALAAGQKKEGKEVFLLCRNDSLLSFYEKIGFAAVGRWAQTEPQNGENDEQ